MMSDSQQAALPEAAQGYSGTVRALHWIGALVVIATWGVGISLDSFPRGPERSAVMGVHSTLGLLVFSLAVLRILWRSVTPAPAFEGPAWLAAVARAGHAALYALTVALPVTGLLARWAKSGSASLVGGFSLPAPFPLPETKMFGEIHETIAFALAAMVGAHLVAALFHHLVLRDGTLRRMAPGGSR